MPGLLSYLIIRMLGIYLYVLANKLDSHDPPPHTRARTLTTIYVYHVLLPIPPVLTIILNHVLVIDLFFNIVYILNVYCLVCYFFILGH